MDDESYDITQDDLQIGLSYVVMLKYSIAHNERVDKWLSYQVKRPEIGFKIPEATGATSKNKLMRCEIRHDSKLRTGVKRPAPAPATKDTDDEVDKHIDDAGEGN